MLEERAPKGMRTFSVYREEDQSGVSGTGTVLEGAIFSTGLCIVHWLTPPPRGSLNIFDSFDQFMSIHIAPHPTNRARILFDDGAIIEPGEWARNELPAAGGAPEVK